MKPKSEARREEEREPSDRSTDLTPVEGEREGLAHRSLRLSCSSEQVSHRPVESPRARPLTRGVKMEKEWPGSSSPALLSRWPLEHRHGWEIRVRFS